MKIFGLICFAIFHGFFAAWLAVWMLFYPRKPIYLMGFRLPFTPGLLPASRGHLETSIADAVCQQLLLPEVLEEAAIRQGLPKVIRSCMPEHIDTLASDPEFLDTLSKAVSEIVKEYIRKKNGLKSELDPTALVPYGKSFGVSFEGFLSSLWRQVEAAVERVCFSSRFKTAMQGAIRRIADDLRKDGSPLALKVETLAGKMVSSSFGALNLRNIVMERLSSFSNEEIEELVNTAAGHHLQSIKLVAAGIGVFFGLISVFLFN